MIKFLFRINLLKVGFFCIDSGESIVCFVSAIIKYLNPTLGLDMKLKIYIIRIRYRAGAREHVSHGLCVVLSKIYKQSQTTSRNILSIKYQIIIMFL